LHSTSIIAITAIGRPILWLYKELSLSPHAYPKLLKSCLELYPVHHYCLGSGLLNPSDRVIL
jgi:hypothetical protein